MRYLRYDSVHCIVIREKKPVFIKKAYSGAFLQR